MCMCVGMSVRACACVCIYTDNMDRLWPGDRLANQNIPRQPVVLLFSSTKPPPPGLTGTEQLANGRCYSEKDNENKARSTAGLTFATPTSRCY